MTAALRNRYTLLRFSGVTVERVTGSSGMPSISGQLVVELAFIKSSAE